MATDFIAGCIGGCAGVLVGHPLDTVKVHLQTQNASRPIYKGTLHCIQTVVVKQGIGGLYRGITSPLVGVAGINAIVFGVYGNAQRRFNDPNSLMTHLLAGSTAGLVQSVVCSPMELAKTRAQVSGGNLTPSKCIKEIYKIEGIRGIFRGLTITIMREIPAFGSYFVTYEAMTRGDSNISTARMLVAGGVAGCVSWGIVYPVDVIKSRVQVDGMGGTPKYKGTWDCLRKSIALEGYGFLGRGLAVTLLRAFPTNAATFTAVTWSMRLMSGDVSFAGATEEAAIAWWLQCENAISFAAAGGALA